MKVQGCFNFSILTWMKNGLADQPERLKNDYAFIAGHLFLSETGQDFSPIQDEIKGFNFDPQFSIAGRQIKFNMPPHHAKFDSVRIKLP